MIVELAICCLGLLTVDGKIYSRDFDVLRSQTLPTLRLVDGIQDSRPRRSATGHNSSPSSTTANSTLVTNEFSLHGEYDNEVFVFWTGEKNDTVLVLTRENSEAGLLSSTLWRSTDYGVSYYAVELPAEARINHMYSSPGNRSKMILSDVQHDRLYITRDTGATWDTVKLGFTPNRLLVHPTIPGLVLAYSLQKMTLYTSQDFGSNWTFLKELVTEKFFWAVPGVDEDPYTVHMEVQSPTGPVSYFPCRAPDCQPIKFDNSLGNIDFFSLLVQNEYIFVQKSTDDSTGLYVSYNRGPFRKAFFPLNLNPVDFNVIETDDHQVLMAVDHEEAVAHLYLSDVTGQFYVISMENVVGMRFPGKFDVDLVKIKGMRGIYIGNRFLAHRNHGGTFQQKTYVTFNKGGNWNLIPAPNSAECTGVCNVHLHLGNTNRFFGIPLVKCDEGAPGLILAHGSVGEFLDLDTSVYISRDAGHSWYKAPFEGNFHLNILDQGSAISAVYADGETSEVHVSWDEGVSWHTHPLADHGLTIDGVVNEPGIKTFITTVFGHAVSGLGWTMVQLNFSSIFTRQCTDDDFELWYPTGEVQVGKQSCILGEKIMFERRKQTSECFYGNDYSRPKSSQTCMCTRQDFECDYGYNLSEDGKCLQAPWFDADLIPSARCVDGKYNHTKGYRKIPSSSCYGGEEELYSSILETCPVYSPKGLTITAGKAYIACGSNVTFRLSQESGSEQETNYTWSFGDGSIPQIVRGLQQAAVIVHSFSRKGLYNVSVRAVNSRGEATVTLPVHVEDSLMGLLVEIPWGVRAKSPSFFNVTVLGLQNSSAGEPSIHFVWMFENQRSQDTQPLRQLTWQSVIQQTFDQPGQYVLKLEVFNSVSSLFYTQAVDVYDSITTVRLHFSRTINQYNSSSLNVRQALAEILCHNLAQILEVRRSRIIMSVQPFSPIVGDLSVLPPNPGSNESDTDMIVDMLIDQAKRQYLAFPIFTDNDIVTITDAAILDLTTGQEVSYNTTPASPQATESSLHAEEDKGDNFLAVYVAVPIIVAGLVVASVWVMYLKRKEIKMKTYTLIMRKNDGLIEDDDSSLDQDVPFASDCNRSSGLDGNSESEATIVIIHNEDPSSNAMGRSLDQC